MNDILNQSLNYLVGKDLGTLVMLIEDYIDRRVVYKTDFSEGKDFEEVAKSLSI